MLPKCVGPMLAWHRLCPPDIGPTHCSDVIMGGMVSKKPVSRLFAEPFVQAQIKENIKAPSHWPL